MSYPLLNAFWTMCMIFLWVMWLFLLFRVVTDVFRSRNMSGLAKTGWLLLVILVPFVGVLVYVLARGRGMGERELAQAQQQQEQFKAYIQETAVAGGGTRGVDQLARLAELKSHGDLTEEEFARAKEKILAA